jgi:protein-tyrosine phosphatase
VLEVTSLQVEPLGKVLLVCVGNVCRSPMAAALLQERLSGLQDRSLVESAGIGALVGQQADVFAVELMRNRGLDLSQHRGRQLTRELAARFDLILVMDERQQRAVENIFPPARGRVHRLGRFGNFDIPDPYGKPRAAFEHSLALIERGIDDFVRAFWSPK